MKICTKCKIEKPKTEFYKNNASKNGIAPKCKECYQDYYAANSERVSMYGRDYRSKNSSIIAARKRKYDKEKSDKVNKRREKYRSENRDKINESQRKYQKENHEKCLSHWRNRRSRSRNAEGAHTAADIKTIFTNQRGLCAECEIKLVRSGKNKFHVDHIQPLAKGGSNDKHNIQCLCPTCNMRKSAKDPIEWAKENGRLI